MATSRSSDGASGPVTFRLFRGSFLVVAPFRFRQPAPSLRLKWQPDRKVSEARGVSSSCSEGPRSTWEGWTPSPQWGQ